MLRGVPDMHAHAGCMYISLGYVQVHIHMYLFHKGVLVSGQEGHFVTADWAVLKHELLISQQLTSQLLSDPTKSLFVQVHVYKYNQLSGMIDAGVAGAQGQEHCSIDGSRCWAQA